MRRWPWLPLALASSFILPSSPVFAVSPDPKGKTLVVCDDEFEPRTLDPHKEFTEKNHTIVQQIFDGLVRFDEEGRILPSLAVSWRRVDPLSMEFRLRQGVRFHNGEPFDAKSVKFSIERYLNPDTGFPALGFLNSLKEVKIVDSHTVRIFTHFPDGLILNRLAGFIVMVPPGYVEANKEEDLKERPVGTGPFRFSRWVKGERIELEANPDYWDERRPKIDRLVFSFIVSERQINALISGGVDVVTEVPGTETFKVENSPGTKVIKKTTLFTVAASLKIDKGPLSRLKVRQALNYAIDKKDLIRYDLLGNGRAVDSLVLSGHPGFDSLKGLEGYKFDLEKARRLLAEEGFAEGFDLMVLEVKAKRTAKIIKSHLMRVGVNLRITSSSDADIARDVQAGGWDIILGSSPDPMFHPFFLNSIFLHSKSPFSLIRDPYLDQLISELLIPEAGPDHEARVVKLARYVNENALGLFTYQRIKTYGVPRNLNFTPSASGMPYFDTAEYVPGRDR